MILSSLWCICCLSVKKCFCGSDVDESVWMSSVIRVCKFISTWMVMSPKSLFMSKQGRNIDLLREFGLFVRHLVFHSSQGAMKRFSIQPDNSVATTCCASNKCFALNLLQFGHQLSACQFCFNLFRFPWFSLDNLNSLFDFGLSLHQCISIRMFLFLLWFCLWFTQITNDKL